MVNSVRKRILEKYQESNHFHKRVSEREIKKKVVIETIKLGIERRLLKDKVRYKHKNYIVIASTSTFDLITTYKVEPLIKKGKPKKKVNKFGTGRSKKASIEYRRSKNQGH